MKHEEGKAMINRADIESLLTEHNGFSVSIYMPVSRIGDPQDAIRYKNILSLAEKKLIRQGMRPAEARAFLEPEYAFQADPDYWMHLGEDGLAVFRSRKRALRYHLPISFDEQVIVSAHYHIRPLIPLLAFERYLVLALSRNEIRLFNGDRYQLTEMELPENTPESMAEVLQYDDPERQLQYHTKTGSTAGKRRAMFHGQGVGIDEEKENLERYFQAVDSSLFPLLEDQEFPVILAGVEELHTAYRRISSAKTILSEGIAGNVKDIPEKELQQKAWNIAARYFSAVDREQERDYKMGLTRGMASNALHKVLEAAFYGRVDTLYVAAEEYAWGVFDPVRHEVIELDEENPAAVELLDQAVVWTFSKNGKIYVKKRDDMPGKALICAKFRY